MKLSLGFLMVFLALNASAQKTNKVKLGLSAGFGLAGIRMNDYPDYSALYDGARLDEYSSALSSGINIFLEVINNRGWGGSIEPGFILKGASQRSNGSGNVMTRLTYLQMPLLGSYDLNKKLEISVGPEISILLSAKQKFHSQSYGYNNFYNRDMEISGLIGLAYSVSDHMDVGVRYGHGFTYISKFFFDDIEGTNDREIKQYNQYLNLTFRLGLLKF